MISDERLAAIEAREREATPGPWYLDGGRVHVAPDWRSDAGFGVSSWSDAADAKFIACARRDVPDLTRAPRAERERVAVLKRALWSLNDWLAETGYGEAMPPGIRRACGRALALTPDPKEPA